MRARDWTALTTLGLFVVPCTLVVYAAWFGGQGVEDGVHSIVKALRGAGGKVPDLLVDTVRFFTSWWWFIAIASMAVSTLVATCLAATEPEASVAAKALWVLSFFLLGVTVPVYCIWQIGGRPGQSLKRAPPAQFD